MIVTYMKKTADSKLVRSQRPNVRTKSGDYWIWIMSSGAPHYDITGKYLFFSANKNRLIEIAKSEILNHEFHLAKVNSELLGKNTEFVLCLYYKDDSRKHELASRQRTEYPDVKYRYWKSNQATLEGEYSKEFLEKLGEVEKRHFTSKNKEDWSLM